MIYCGKMNKEIVKSLQKIGVDTRFVSINDKSVLINNLKFSRFSRKKEELFKKIYPEIDVVRSKIFQKICMRASRNLAHCIRPKEKIFLIKDDNPYNYVLHAVLEPYQRKYGIELIFGNTINESRDLNVDLIAIPSTLDDEAENILNLMLEGKKIKLLSSVEKYNDIKLIYPLINVPISWINSWMKIEVDDPNQNYESSEHLLKFLETIIPDVRENLVKSAIFIS